MTKEKDRAQGRITKDLVFKAMDGKLEVREWEEDSEGIPELRKVASVPMTEEGVGLALKTAVAVHYKDLQSRVTEPLIIYYTARELGTPKEFKGQYP